MLTLIIKRSSCDSGRSCVPEDPTGFSVAMTTNGDGTQWFSPSTVTLPSSITSRSAACVLLEVRLISSARRRLHITAPGRYMNWPVCFSYMVNPVTSDGTTSGVNWIRLNSIPIRRLRASAVVVFPTPGTSSRRMWPLASTAMMILSVTAFFPLMIVSSSFWSCVIFSGNVFSSVYL